MIDVKKLVFRCVIYALVTIGSIWCAVIVWNLLHGETKKIEEKTYTLTLKDYDSYSYNNNSYAISIVPNSDSECGKNYGLFMEVPNKKDSYSLLLEMECTYINRLNSVKQKMDNLYVLETSTTIVNEFTLNGKETTKKVLNFTYDGVTYENGVMKEDKDNKFKSFEGIIDVDIEHIYLRGFNELNENVNYTCSLEDYKCRKD